MSARGTHAGKRGTRPTYTDAVLFVRELRTRLGDREGADLSHEELTMVFVVLDSLIPSDEHDA